MAEVKIPLTRSEAEAIAFRPILSWSNMRTMQAGKMAVALSENMVKGVIPRPSTFLEIAS